VTALARQLIALLETGEAAPGLFAPDVFLDFTSPHWREQFAGATAVVEFRRRSHPRPGKVPRFRLDEIAGGFVLEVEERWDGWYCRELFRADVQGETIAALSVYCTGDWDAPRRAEHAREVRLLRP
jgi:hypothetical protein